MLQISLEVKMTIQSYVNAYRNSSISIECPHENIRCL